MRTYTKKLSTLGLLASLLSACGGSGGGGHETPTVTQFISFNDLPDNGIVEIEGRAVVALFARDLVSGDTLVSNVNNGLDSTARITRQNGSSVKLELTAPFSEASFDLRTDSDSDVSGPLVFFFSLDGQRFAFLLEGSASSPYQHQVLGSWVTGFPVDIGEIAAGAYGNPTPIANLPAGQSATYTGLSIGTARRSDGELYSTISNVDLRTDFRTVSVSSTETEGLNLNTGSIVDASELDFQGGGAVSGTSFTTVVSGPTTLGTADGTFHGPNAEEVAGTYSLFGSGGVVHVGAFGGN
ncbi:MAG: hypothetical protein AAGI09_10645 [Pseudomonadota bacterium]